MWRRVVIQIRAKSNQVDSGKAAVQTVKPNKVKVKHSPKALHRINSRVAKAARIQHRMVFQLWDRIKDKTRVQQLAKDKRSPKALRRTKIRAPKGAKVRVKQAF